MNAERMIDDNEVNIEAEQLLLSFYRRNQTLQGFAVIFLLLFGSAHYYQLNIALLTKSTPYYSSPDERGGISSTDLIALHPTPHSNGRSRCSLFGLLGTADVSAPIPQLVHHPLLPWADAREMA